MKKISSNMFFNAHMTIISSVSINEYLGNIAMTVTLRRKVLKEQLRSNTVQLRPLKVQQPLITEESPGRSITLNRDSDFTDSSKLGSSLLIPIKKQRNTPSPMKLVKVDSIIKEERPSIEGKLNNVLFEISRIDTQLPITMSIKNLRIQRNQLLRYFQKSYPPLICESIMRALKVQPVFTQTQYEQWIGKLQRLDTNQTILLCFIIYDYQNEGYITLKNLLNLLVYREYKPIEEDILRIVSQSRVQLASQREHDYPKQFYDRKNPYSLPISIFQQERLDQSQLINPRRLSLVSDRGGRRFSTINTKHRSVIFKSIDLSVDQQEEAIFQKPLRGNKKLLITQLEQSEMVLSQIRENQPKLSISLSDTKPNILRIDRSTFQQIWYPIKPAIFTDILKSLINPR